ncbi:hypothetical protein V6N11_071423 [Hibiscus sabdariffa]|uniref:Uncharacterized protein n=1 Tax=Hibiscus sabdariffa TaxID=183260 RepID=A0ABR2U0R4_9ROSI
MEQGEKSKNNTNYQSRNGDSQSESESESKSESSSESESESESSSKSVLKSASERTVKSKSLVMVEAKNVIRMGKVQNKKSWQPREEDDRALGKPELSTSGLNATPLIAVEPTFNNEVGVGGNKSMLNKEESQPTKGSDASWVDVVSRDFKGEVGYKSHVEDEWIAICMGKDYFDGGNRTVMEDFRSMGEQEILGGGLNKASLVGGTKIERLSEVGKSKWNKKLNQNGNKSNGGLSWVDVVTR